jgi:outer membrane immunogenic protein
MKKLLLAIVGLAAMIAGPAVAADLRVKAPVYKAPPPVVLFSWTGFYVGVHGGGDWFNKDWFVPLSPLNAANGCIGCPVSAGGHTSSSWLAGVQAGFNYQINWFVVGVEAQASWTRLEASNAQLVLPFLIDNSRTDRLGTIAARLGAAWDRSLFFVKGGAAWAHDTFWTTSVFCNTVTCQTVTDTRWGWMVGVGWEYAFFDNWSVKLEYDHLDFGRQRETLTPVCAGCGPFDYDVRQTIDLVKVGLNYRFGWSPVVAKY